jgi:hypothetical protein
MKKIIVTFLLSVASVLTVQLYYIKSASKSDLLKTISTIKNQSSEVDSSKQSETETLSKTTLNIGILDVKTGFYAGNLWYPSTIVTFKNNTGQDIKEYIKSKAIFINTETNEQIGVHTKYLSTSHELFLQGTSLRKQFKSDVGYRGTITGLKISMRLYLEDQLIGTYTIKNRQL